VQLVYHNTGGVCYSTQTPAASPWSSQGGELLGSSEHALRCGNKGAPTGIGDGGGDLG
jgi:hypothetical protein